MRQINTHALDGGHTLILTSNQNYHFFPKHYHETYSVAMLIQGAKDFRTNSRSGVLNSSNIATMNPYEIHCGESLSSGGWKQLVVLFDSFSSSRFAEENELRKNILEFSDSVREDKQFRLMMQNICTGISHASCELEKENLFELMMASIFSAEKAMKPVRSFSNQPGMSKAADMMKDAPDKKHSLEELAKSAGMSKFHFLRSFKEATGMTPHAYLNIARVEKARRLLLTTEKSIAETAVECGFSDQAHLSRAYKKIYGAPPGSLRIK